ncbi:MAG TPA: HD domain-containing phosphohydrolase [Solirubrobacteraceae bacterium]|jgi:putative nucleotidyltransferase with HDIG domain|nr:HD domain-containing phosphohydrolase [Solirubrobacteraceae bacterium]
MRYLKRHKYGIYMGSQVLLLGGAVAGAVLSSRAVDWHPLPLLGLLLVLAGIGEWVTVTIGGQNLSASFIALVLAMTLMGPAPAVAIGIVAITVDTVHRRPELADWLKNFATYATYILLGGLFCQLLIGDSHSAGSFTKEAPFALVVLGVFALALLLNFLQVAVHTKIMRGNSLIGQIRMQFLPILPSQLAAAGLSAILAIAYTNLGYAVLVALVVVIFIFQYLTVALLRSEDRAEQLQARSMHLASLQLGVLVTLVETLALRDRAAARHAASVARYARALAAEMGLPEADQDVVHTASLLHDVGKFALPDRILHAEVLSDADWATIRRHPQDGATLVGRLDGYGPVADIILYHHENVDGSGYPAGLIGNEIPLLARVLAVCNAYDTLTARDSYRSPMTPQDALAELRRVAGRQLDGEIVQSFVALVEREGPAAFTRSDEADFETELSFEHRARALATPAR